VRKVTTAIVPASGTPRISAPEPDHDRVEGRDDRHSGEGVAQPADLPRHDHGDRHRQAHVAGDEPRHHRSVLEHEERGEGGEGEEEE
jgi:hypothetical protein